MQLGSAQLRISSRELRRRQLQRPLSSVFAGRERHGNSAKLVKLLGFLDNARHDPPNLRSIPVQGCFLKERLGFHGGDKATAPEATKRGFFDRGSILSSFPVSCVLLRSFLSLAWLIASILTFLETPVLFGLIL